MSSKNSSLAIYALIFFGLFVTFTVAVGLNFLTKIDTETTIFFQSITPRFLDLPFSLLSLLGSFEVTTALLAAILISTFSKKVKQAIYIVLAFLIGTLVELSGKLYLFHPSPPKLFFRHVDILFPTTYVYTNYSYPSGHMFRTTFLIIFAFYLLGPLKSKMYKGILFTIILISMAISRIYLGEHWLSDVIGGVLLGSFFSILLIEFLKVTSQLKGSLSN